MEFNDKEVLRNKGKISKSAVDVLAYERYDVFNERRKREEARLADEEDLVILNELEAEVKNRNRET